MAAKKNTKKAAPKKAAPKKKPAAKKPVKKAAPKKAAPKKKPAAKKTVKKAAPKKAVKKPIAKKTVKKVSKPVAKKTVKKVAKPVAKKPAKKDVAAKKPVTKEVKKISAKVEKASPVSKKEAKAEPKAKIEKIAKVAAPEPKKPEMRMATSKPKKESSHESPKKSILSQPTDIKAFANLQKTFKIPVAKPNVMKVVPANTDTRSRYSDAELHEFKEIILTKLVEAKRDLEMLRGSLSHTDDHGTDDTSPTFKMMEDGSETLSREETAQLAGRQEKFILALENALVRIENKTYGICRVTGKLISKDRLKLVPHTTLSIEAKNMQD